MKTYPTNIIIHTILKYKYTFVKYIVLNYFFLPSNFYSNSESIYDFTCLYCFVYIIYLFLQISEIAYGYIKEKI